MTFFYLFAASQLIAGVEEGKEPGILGPPSVEDGIIYFLHWPGTLYAFDENTNEVRWSGKLDPPLDIESIDPADFPIPAPMPVKTNVIVHIGSELWVESKIDGSARWHLSNVPPASRDRANATSNTLPGFYAVENDSEGAILTLEDENGFWYCRRRMLGNGDLKWENRIAGEPRGWWFDRDKVWIAYELYGETGPGSSNDMPGSIICYDIGTGEMVWATEILDGSMFKGAFRVADSRLYLIELKSDGQYHVRAFAEESGDFFKDISYAAGNYIDTLVSSDKIIFLHEDGSPESNQAKFNLYYSSLNPIKFQTLRMAREDQLFPNPEINGNLFLYAGASYSVYDGRLVWQEHIQRRMVDWAADDYNLYIWDSGGSLLGFDRLTGSELWRTEFNVLPGETQLGPNHGGASLSLVDGWLYAGTPSGELVRIDPSSGELHPGIIRVTRVAVENTNSDQSSDGKRGGSSWLWISILIVVLLGGYFLWFSLRKPIDWDNGNAKSGF